MVDHTHLHKATFDKRVKVRPPREDIFEAGGLVQTYRSKLDYIFRTEGKLLPKFFVPQRIISCDQHSYKIEI